MDPLSLTASLIAILQITVSITSTLYTYRSSASSSSHSVQQILSSLNALKAVLESLLLLIETSKPGELSTVETLVKDGGALQSCMDELERLKGKLEGTKGGKLREMRDRLVWPMKEEEVVRALEGLERWKGVLGLALSADQASLSLGIKDGMDDLTGMFQRHSTDMKRQDIYRWLAAPDPYTNHVTNRKKRQPHTGVWLLRSKQYEHWLHSEKSFLWIYGIPGSGKTVLCSTVIEQLIRYCQQFPETALTYFYFDFNDTDKRDTNSLLRSLITQLASQSDTIPVSLLELYDDRPVGSKVIEDQSLFDTLQNLILIFHNVYIVLDALDESSDCEELLNFIHKIQGWGLSRLHLVTTSRQLPDIEELLTDLATEKICLQDSEMNEDIILYVADKLKNDKTLSKFPPDIRLQITTKLLEGEDGMFQWVVCQLDMLRRCMSVAAIRKALAAGFPKNLDQTYDQILLQIDELHQQDVLKTLQALTATVEALTLEEIVEILAVDLDSDPPSFDPDSRLLDPRSILSMCSSLVTAVKASRWYFYPERHEVMFLKLAHASVADYLTQPKTSGPSLFHFSITPSRQFLAQCCLAYLMDPEFGTGSKTQWQYRGKSEQEATRRAFPLLNHAVNNWPRYLQKEPGDPDDYLEPRTMEILQAFFDTWKTPSGGNYTTWVGMLIPDVSYERIRKTQPIYYASAYGLTDIVNMILEAEKDIDVDALGGRAHSTALHVATYRNHIDVVKILLERGADPNLRNDVDEAPLYWAAVNGNQEMQELLLKGGSTDLKGVWGRHFEGLNAQDRLDQILMTRDFKLDIE